jgi:hypothetical protein
VKKANFARTGVIFTAVMAALIGLWACEQAQSGLDEVFGGGGGGAGNQPQNAYLRVVFNFSDKPSPQNTQTSASVGGLSPLFTVHPAPEALVFDNYKLIFTHTNGGVDADHDVLENEINTVTGEIAAIVELVEGTYTVKAEAYKNNALIAVGTRAGVVVSSGITATANITMGPNLSSAGTGSFSYNITFPDNAAGTMSFKDSNMQPIIGSDVLLVAGSSPVTGVINDLPAGFYFVSVALIDDSDPQRQAGVVEALHIYEGLISELNLEYNQADFSEYVVVDDFNLTPYFTAPVALSEPEKTLEGGQYLGAIQWKTGSSNFTGDTFATNTVYTAVVTLTAKQGYFFDGVAADSFTHENAVAHSNAANSGTVTFTFPQTGETDDLNVTVGFDYVDITITGLENGIIYKDGSPGQLTLTVEGFSENKWYIDVDLSNPLPGNPVTLNAADYVLGKHTASFTGKKNDIPYSKSVDFIVAAAPPLSALSLIPTANNTSLVPDNGPLTGDTIAFTAKTGGLIAGTTDQYDPNVYFKVSKESGQDIIVSGDDEAYVTIVTDESTVDGSLTSDETGVVTVRPKPVIGGQGEMLDTQFDGGVYSFTLASNGQSVNITLTVEPHLTGTAVFLVNAKTADDVAGLPGGTNVLTRLDGIKKAAVTGDSLADSASTVSATDAPTTGNYLLSALARVDRLANSTGNEYLIRVEHSEALPKVMLTCNYPATEADTVAIRLRGLDSGARTITYDDIGLGYSYFDTNREQATDASAFGRAVINIGDPRTTALYTAYITLALENNIALAGKGSEYTDSANTTAMVQVNKDTKFIMRNGSKITNYYNTTGTNLQHSVVLIHSQSDERGYFEMYGGEITGNTVPATKSGIVTVYSATPMTDHFKKWGGRIYNNSYNYFFYTSDSDDKYNIPTTEGAWEIE